MQKTLHDLINKLATARLKKQLAQEEEDNALTEIVIYLEGEDGRPTTKIDK